ncbi:MULTISPECIES: SDR family NAD(P)-dependent oxidoreductase [unclassified Mesorhizobium]|uniref:SDR family NAD(P)-dependent oxidoreductase n=1 Tax=unclassified Mesorhizobium TaxID=325217 RepID=UPI0012EBC36D
MRLDNKTAIVTGAASGIGLAIAMRLGTEGARVSRRGWRQGPEGAHAVRQGALRGAAITVLSTCAHAFGRLVIIVNNAPAW